MPPGIPLVYPFADVLTVFGFFFVVELVTFVTEAVQFGKHGFDLFVVKTVHAITTAQEVVCSHHPFVTAVAGTGEVDNFARRRGGYRKGRVGRRVRQKEGGPDSATRQDSQ